MVRGSLAWIRDRYGAPARRGVRVRYGMGTESEGVGVITSASHYLSVKPDGWPQGRVLLHPTWKIQYLDENNGVLWDSEDEQTPASWRFAPA